MNGLSTATKEALKYDVSSSNAIATKDTGQPATEVAIPGDSLPPSTIAQATLLKTKEETKSKQDESKESVFTLEQASDFGKRLQEVFTSPSDCSCSSLAHAPQLLSLALEAKTAAQRSSLIIVIRRTQSQSHDEVLAALLTGGLLGTLKGWIEATDMEDAASRGLLVHVLDTLASLPVSEAHLQSSMIGKTIAQFKTVAAPDVAAAAEKTLSVWRSRFSSRISTRQTAIRVSLSAAASERPAATAVPAEGAVSVSGPALASSGLLVEQPPGALSKPSGVKAGGAVRGQAGGRAVSRRLGSLTGARVSSNPAIAGRAGGSDFLLDASARAAQVSAEADVKYATDIESAAARRKQRVADGRPVKQVTIAPSKPSVQHYDDDAAWPGFVEELDTGCHEAAEVAKHARFQQAARLEHHEERQLLADPALPVAGAAALPAAPAMPGQPDRSELYSTKFLPSVPWPPAGPGVRVPLANGYAQGDDSDEVKFQDAHNAAVPIHRDPPRSLRPQPSDPAAEHCGTAAAPCKVFLFMTERTTENAKLIQAELDALPVLAPPEVPPPQAHDGVPPLMCPSSHLAVNVDNVADTAGMVAGIGTPPWLLGARSSFKQPESANGAVLKLAPGSEGLPQPGAAAAAVVPGAPHVPANSLVEIDGVLCNLQLLEHTSGHPPRYRAVRAQPSSAHYSRLVGEAEAVFEGDGDMTEDGDGAAARDRGFPSSPPISKRRARDGEGFGSGGGGMFGGGGAFGERRMSPPRKRANHDDHGDGFGGGRGRGRGGRGRGRGRVCMYWQSDSGCFKGDQCEFWHEGEGKDAGRHDDHRGRGGRGRGGRDGGRDGGREGRGRGRGRRGVAWDAGP